MSKKRNRSKLNGDIYSTSRNYKIILENILYPCYYDEGWSIHYKNFKRDSGFKSPGKFLYKYQIRQYKTWKYNRKTQYKNEKYT